MKYGCGGESGNKANYMYMNNVHIYIIKVLIVRVSVLVNKTWQQ